MKPRISSCRLLLLAFGASILLAAGACAPGSTEVDEAALADFTALALITQNEGMRAPEEAVVALRGPVVEGAASPPRKVWRYEKAELVPAGPEDLERALGDDRSQWPPYTVVFHFDSISPDEATVDAAFYYDAGIVEDSRGGFSARWHLTRQSRQWVVDQQELTMLWD